MVGQNFTDKLPTFFKLKLKHKLSKLMDKQVMIIPFNDGFSNSIVCYYYNTSKSVSFEVRYCIG